MSLAQHVSSTEGIDYQRLEPSIDPQYSSTKVIRRVLSYDAFPPAQIEDQADHTAAYKVSTARRAGESIVDRENEHPTYGISSPSRHHCPCLLARFWNCLWLCCYQACSDIRRRLSRIM